MESVGQGVPKRMWTASEKGWRCLFSSIWRAWLPFVISRSRVRVTSLAPALRKRYNTCGEFFVLQQNASHTISVASYFPQKAHFVYLPGCKILRTVFRCCHFSAGYSLGRHFLKPENIKFDGNFQNESERNSCLDSFLYSEQLCEICQIHLLSNSCLDLYFSQGLFWSEDFPVVFYWPSAALMWRVKRFFS